MSNFKSYKNLISTFPDILKPVIHFIHYTKNMNKAKTGCFFLHNLNLALLNLLLISNLIRHSSKQVSGVVYYPFSNKYHLENFEFHSAFLDFPNDEVINYKLKEINVEHIIFNINKRIDKLNTLKLSKEEILTEIDHIQASLWVLYTCYKLYIDKYENSFKKEN